MLNYPHNHTWRFDGTISCVYLFVGTGHKLVIEFHAHREKLLQERVTVKSQDSTKYRELHLHARVLGNINVAE